MTAQPEALRLADALEISSNHGIRREAAAELRRLHAQRDALLEALKTVEWHGGGSCWIVDADKIATAIAQAEENT